VGDEGTKRLRVVRPQNQRPRDCGNCRACCTVLGVSELAKPRDCACPHAKKDKGCTLFGKADRPKSCTDYRCFWLDGLFERRDRPDRLGLIFDDREPILDWLEKECGFRVVVVREVSPGANRSKRARALLVETARRVPVIYIGVDLPGVLAESQHKYLMVAAALTKLDMMSDADLNALKQRALGDYDMPVRALLVDDALRGEFDKFKDEMAQALESGGAVATFDIARDGTVSVEAVRAATDDEKPDGDK
jgi:uncharacterized protein